jgi:RNA polymerase primary sigma factor
MSSEMSPLFRLAIASGRAETVRSHLERGADPNARDNTGATALLLAASRGRQDICEILIDHGADTSASDGTGRTVLDYATQWGFDLTIDDAAPMELSTDQAAAIQESGIADTSAGAKDSHPVQQADALPALSPAVEDPTEAPGTTAGTLLDAVALALGLHEAEPSANEDGVQSSDGWEAEPEFLSRPADDARIAAAEVAHETFSRPSAAVDASDWSQVAVALPVELGSASPQLPGPLRDLILDALRDGRIAASGLREGLSRTKNGREYARPIRILLSDLGVTVDTSTLGAVLDAEAPAAQSKEVEPGALEDAAEFLGSLLTNDPETAYLESIRALREDALGLQPILWARAEELRRRLAHVFARMPGGLELLEGAGALFATDQDEDTSEEEDSEEGPGEDEDEEAALNEAPVEDQHPNEESHLATRFADLTPNELALELAGMRLRPTVFEDAARRARELRAEGFEDAIAFAAELRGRLNRIVETNLGLVAWVAKRYRNKGMEPLDLIQEGSIGLMKAVEKYDPDRGATLGTYATWWIRQSITRAMADLCRTIRVPVHLQERARKLERVRQELHSELGRPATATELAEEMEISLDALVRLQRLTGTLVTRGNNVERLTREMTTGLVDPQANPEDAMWDGRMRQEIADQLLELTPREERVVRLRFGIGMADELTLEQVGETFEVTRERIRQIEAKALRRLSHPSRTKRLKGALDVQ